MDDFGPAAKSVSICGKSLTEGSRATTVISFPSYGETSPSPMRYGSTLGSPVSKMIGRTGAWSKERSTVEHCSCTCGSSIIRMIIWPCMCTAVLQIRGLGGSVSWPTQYVSIAINPTYPTQSYPRLTDIRSRFWREGVRMCVSTKKRLIYDRNSWFKWCWLAHTEKFDLDPSSWPVAAIIVLREVDAILSAEKITEL